MLHELDTPVTIGMPPLHSQSAANIWRQKSSGARSNSASSTTVTNKIRATWAHTAYQELKRRRCKATLALEQTGLTELSVLDKERWIPFDKEVMFFGGGCRALRRRLFWAALGAQD